MKVIYDNQIFSFQKYGGISRTFVELIKRIKEMDGCKVFVVALGSNNYYLNTLKNKRIKSDKWTNSYLRMLLYNWINKLIIKLKCVMNPDCILHTTYYDTWYLDHCAVKIVCTIHDMIFERISNSTENFEKIIQNKKRYIYESDIIIAVSENTKKDILYYYPDVPKDKIKVIYHGNSMEEVKKDKDICKKYILFVGNRDSYKNFNVVLRSMESIVRHFERDIDLICVGGGAFSLDEKKLITSLKLDKRVVQKNCNDEELAHLYTNAICFVFSSYYEGFGIPILEAWNCGCPVVLSNTSCFPEIAGDAALYFEPDNDNELTEKILDIISDEKLQKALVQKGKCRLKFYDWQIASDMLYEAYSQILDENL